LVVASPFFSFMLDEFLLALLSSAQLPTLFFELHLSFSASQPFFVAPGLFAGTRLFQFELCRLPLQFCRPLLTFELRLE
jgi:hypothetical protein